MLPGKDDFQLDIDELLVKYVLGGGLFLSAGLVLFLVLGAIFGIAYIVVSGTVADSVDSQILETSIDVFGIMINGTLTIFLILLYWDIRGAERGQEDLMKQQKEILEEQQDLRKATFRPDLRCQFLPSKTTDDHAYVQCYNDGLGRAENLGFKLSLSVWKGEYQHIEELDGHNFTAITDVGESKVDQTKYGDVDIIEGFSPTIAQVMYVNETGERLGKQAAVEDRENQKFRFTVRVNHFHGAFADPIMDGRLKSLSTVTTRLAELEYDMIGYQISIEYKDVLGDTVEEYQFASGIAELNSEMSFEDIVESSSGSLSTIDALGHTSRTAFFRY